MVEVASRERVPGRVIPAGIERWHPAHAGTFILFELPKSKPSVHREQYSSSTFLHEPEDGRAYREATGALRQLVMSPEDSTELIARIANETENSQ
ncbi:Scr1 family TA system antitoxin-like transcriptional regulator [Actinopolyspora sp. H202]|uniref:Scr1 family TA system antitoxin-like transcriptional regulator n=1 Tax=Actinopolyspora sp. H202 TaxID=1500456 RepID=UPI003EE7922E